MESTFLKERSVLAFSFALLMFFPVAFAQDPAVTRASDSKEAFRDILSELDKPLPTPTPRLQYECTRDGIKAALVAIMKVLYRAEDQERLVSTKQERMINDLERTVKLASKPGANPPDFDSAEAEGNSFAKDLERNIGLVAQDFQKIEPMRAACSLASLKDDRAANDLLRRITTIETILGRLREQPDKLRAALGKVREAFSLPPPAPTAVPDQLTPSVPTPAT